MRKAAETTVIRVLVALSLTLNLVFAVLLIRGQQPQTTATPLTPAKQPLVDAGAAASIASYHRALDTKGLSGNERAALMLAYLQERFAPTDAPHLRHASFCDAPAKVLDRATTRNVIERGR